jgi:hypothetical protein
VDRVDAAVQGEESLMSRHGTSKKRAIKQALFRLGLQARPAQVVATLAARGIWVGAGLVRAVVFELLQDTARSEAQRTTARSPIIKPIVRRPARVPPLRGKRN